ncbi:MAG: outer membrane protein [Gammaproteobacteria bacterium]
MKKLGILFAATLLFGQSAHAYTYKPANENIAPFRVSSFYLGAGIGSSFLSYHTVIVEPKPTIINEYAGHGVLGNLQAGYQFSCNKYSLAIDGFANVTSQRTSSYAIFGPSGGHRNMQFINDWNAGVSILPGYLFNDYLIAFLRLGYINSHYEINVKAHGAQHFSKNLPGGQIGLGGEVWFPMLKHFSVRGEFDTIIAPGWRKIGAFTCTTGCHDNANVNIANNLFQINFIYHFI